MFSLHVSLCVGFVFVLFLLSSWFVVSNQLYKSCMKSSTPSPKEASACTEKYA